MLALARKTSLEVAPTTLATLCPPVTANFDLTFELNLDSVKVNQRVKGHTVEKLLFGHTHDRLLHLDYCWSVTIGFEAITAVTVAELHLVTVSNLFIPKHGPTCTRSTGTVHISAKARLTAAIRIRISGSVIRVATKI